MLMLIQVLNLIFFRGYLCYLSAFVGDISLHIFVLGERLFCLRVKKRNGQFGLLIVLNMN